MAKIALVYDRVNTPFGGAEHVLLALHDIFPKAPLFTSLYDPQRATWAKVFDVRPSFLQSIPGKKTKHRAFAPLMPLAFESHDLSSYDLVISITSAEAKGVLTRPDQLHICYLLTPTRYLYSHRKEYVASTSWQKTPVISWVGNKLLDYLTWWDKAAANRPDIVVPISKLVAQRAKEFYDIETTRVIYPPIPDATQTSFKENTNKPFYLVLSRLVSYKQIDLAISACKLSGRKLIIAGDGPERKKLETLSRKEKGKGEIIFLGNVSQKKATQLLPETKALLMPGQEDFGITALQANIHGKPVILHHKSGAAEIIKDGLHGVHLKNSNSIDLSSALDKIEKTEWSEENLQSNTIKYRLPTFKKEIKKLIFYHWDKFQAKKTQNIFS